MAVITKSPLTPILILKHAPSSEFIRFWSSQYQYANSELYTLNIGKGLPTAKAFLLFEWKNGGPLSNKKRASIQSNYIESKENPPINGSRDDVESYLNKPGGAIWRIFWLHCHAPLKYPIYDQHVHRAMAKIEGWNELEIPKLNTAKVRTYLQDYLPFWKKFSGFDPQIIDRALWAYGKFLSLGYRFS